MGRRQCMACRHFSCQNPPFGHAGHLPHHLAFQAAAAKHSRTRKLPHHLPHLGVLLDELINFGDCVPDPRAMRRRRLAFRIR